MSKQSKMTRARLFILSFALLVSLIMTGTALAGESAQKSVAPVLWSWDFLNNDASNPVGTSKLVRTDTGISATYKSDVLTPGTAATLWFIVFNYPEECIAGPYMCSPLDLGFGAAAQGDFLLASGHVIGDDGKGNFGGHLNVGDVSGSGLAEVACPDDETMGCAPGLINPDGALVILAVHDHGPKQTGQILREQISSFLGGCIGDFNGNEFGFATGMQDLPDEVGECSTTQFSPHPPMGDN